MLVRHETLESVIADMAVRQLHARKRILKRGWDFDRLVSVAAIEFRAHPSEPDEDRIGYIQAVIDANSMPQDAADTAFARHLSRWSL